MLDFALTKYGSKVRILLCGDFNDLRFHFSEISSLTHLTPIVDFNTRGDSILDQVFVNFARDTNALALPPVASSDHCVVFWSPSPPPKLPMMKKKIRKFSRANVAMFRHTAANTDWLALVKDFDSLNEASECFIDCVNFLFEHCFPIHTIRILHPKSQWINCSVKLLIDDRDKAYHSKNRTKYLRLKKEVIAQVTYLKHSFIKRASSKRDAKVLWSALRSVGRFSKRVSQSRFTVHEFNSFFAGNFQGKLSVSSIVTPAASHCNSSFVVSLDEVYSVLRKLKRGSSGPDGLSPWILRDCAAFFTPAVAHLLNTSVSTGEFPLCLKRANITPIPKREHPTVISDFRPISILPCLSKVFEKIVLRKWLLPVISCKLDSSQFAYVSRPGTGTTCALTLFMHKILHF